MRWLKVYNRYVIVIFYDDQACFVLFQSYLLMNLLQEVNLILQGIDLPL